MLANIFGKACTLQVRFDTDGSTKFATLAKEPQEESAPIYTNGDDVSGTAHVTLKPHKKVEHNGIKVVLVGQIEMTYDKSDVYEFFAISKDLEAPGILMESRMYQWRFNAVEKPYETYWGTNVRLRYFIRLVLARNFNSSVTAESDFAVQNTAIPPEINTTIRMEVGIEDCLQIEFEYDKSSYHLKDVILGKVFFVFVRIKIKHMELDILRVETSGMGPGALTDSQTINKFEIMDGSPARSECIPVRMYLSGFDLTPTYRNVQNKFSVKYYVNLVLVDEDDRRYFKKNEIFFWRKQKG